LNELVILNYPGVAGKSAANKTAKEKQLSQFYTWIQIWQTAPSWWKG